MTRFFARLRQLIRELRRRRVLRVAAVYLGTGFVILQAADILTPALRLPSWTVRFITVLLILGFPLAVGLAWVYNVTEEGLVRIDETAEEVPEGQAGGKPFTSNAVVVGLLVLVAGLLVYDVTYQPNSSSSSETRASGSGPAADTSLARLGKQSVAVLPFTYLAAEDSTDYLSLGMTDELITRLAQVESLSVIGRTSVMRYQGSDKTVPQIGKELGVAHIVEGSVQRVGQQIRVQAQLLDARTGEHEWAESYTRRMENILKLQSDLAQQVAEELQANLLPGQRGQLATERSVDSAAYALYLQGRKLRFDETAESTLRAVKLLRRAVEIDPTFAPAWATLSTAAWLVRPRGGNLPGDLDRDSLAHAAARTALRLDSTSVEAHIALGLVQYVLDGDYLSGGLHLKRAVELAPGHANANREYGGYLNNIGRPQIAEPYVREAIRLSGFQRGWGALAHGAWRQGEYQRAKRLYRKAHRMRPQDFRPLVSLAEVYIDQDSSERALRIMRDLTRDHPNPQTWATLARAYAAAGKMDSARAVRPKFEKSGGMGTIHEADIRMALGQTGRALKILVNLPYWITNPVYRPLRSHPRYQDYVHQLGLDEESVQEIVRRLGETPV